MKCKNMDKNGNCCLTIGHISCTCRSRNERITALQKVELAATDSQQLKAEIADLANGIEGSYRVGIPWSDILIISKLRQLSAI